MIREKDMLRKQVYAALKQEDYETAREVMSKICNDQQNFKRNWTRDETEFLMNHVAALGYDRAIKIVAKKLDRTLLSVKSKYSKEVKKNSIAV